MFTNISHSRPKALLPSLIMIRQVSTMPVEQNDRSSFWILRVMRVPIMPGISTHNRDIVIINDLPSITLCFLGTMNVCSIYCVRNGAISREIGGFLPRFSFVLCPVFAVSRKKGALSPLSGLLVFFRPLLIPLVLDDIIRQQRTPDPCLGSFEAEHRDAVYVILPAQY